MKYRIRLVEAVKNSGEWVWNDSCILEENVEFPDLTNRKVLKYLRNNNYLTAASRGNVRVLMDSSDCIEICAKSTNEPLFFLEPN